MADGAKHKKNVSDDRWSVSRGPRGFTVRVEESTGPGGIVKLHWYEKRKLRKSSLGFSIRDKGGRIIAARKREAIQAADDKAVELEAGEPRPDATGTHERRQLTLQEGFDRFFCGSEGYFAKETSDSRWLERQVPGILKALGRGRKWDEVTPESATRILIRKLAEKNEKAGTRRYRKTERTVDLLHKTGTWLKKEGLIRNWWIPKKWKRQLHDDWSRILGTPPPAPERPRFSVEELAALVAGHDHPDLNPKAGLLFELTWGRRVEQVKKTKRSAVKIEPDGRVTVSVPGTRHKKAGKMELDATQADRLQAAMSEGYLKDLETAYLRGELDDYALFPQGELRNGVAPIGGTTRPCDDTFVSNQFRHLEQLVGVEHQENRGYRGVRRKLTDLNKRFCEDPDVLNHEGSWSSPGVRNLIYSDPDDPIVPAKGAALRAQVRRHLLRIAGGEAAKGDFWDEIEPLLRASETDSRKIDEIRRILGQTGTDNEPSSPDRGAS